MNKYEKQVIETFACPKCEAKKPSYIVTQDHVIVGCNNCRKTLNPYCIYNLMDFRAYVRQTALEIERGIL
jgi:transcription elongation factor Elf1